MRYCAFTLVFALLAGIVGCQSPYYQQRMGRGGPQAVAPGAVPAYFQEYYAGAPNGASQSQSTSQVQFLGPEGVIIHYDISAPGMFDSEAIVCPGVHNFKQGEIYRLKVSNIPMIPGRDLYPTIEIAPTFARTQAFLSHNMIPVEFTDNDFDQVLSGNFITKVIYLPNPEFQGLATAGVGTLINTQLEPGTDPIVEAQNRGSILAVVRIGNKDLSFTTMEEQMEFSMLPPNQMYADSRYTSVGPVPNPPQLPIGTRAPRATSLRTQTLPPGTEMME